MIKYLTLVFLTTLVYSAHAQRTESHSPDSSGIESEFRTMWMPGAPGQKPIARTVQIIDGYVIIEGDIILGREEEIFGPRAAVIRDFGNNRWPGSIIPYEIEDGYPDVNMIKYAINHVINNTNLCLVPRTTQTDYIIFVNSLGCSSYVGRIGGMQPVNVSPNCGVGSTVHEILHAAGFYHEQSRQDRDNFITINTQNIASGGADNFGKYFFGSDIGNYDFGSIMHYGPYSFSSNDLPTIEVKMPPGTSSTNIGQRAGLSDGDISAVNTIYPTHPNCTPLTVSPNLTVRSLGTLSTTGSTVDISECVIQNDGSSGIGSSTANFFYGPQGSNNVTLFGGTKTIPALAAGQTHLLTLTHNLATLPNGTYFFGIWVNHPNNPVESYTVDNIRSWNAALLTLPGCEPALAIDDDPIVSDIYQAGILLTSAGVVGSASTVTFKAGNNVQLQPNFEIEQSAVLEIKIEGCN